MNNHTMIDLETFGLGPTAAIVQIGVVVFDPLGKRPNTIERQWNVTLQSSILGGGTVNQETIEWWDGQGKAAINSLLGPALPLEDALYALGNAIQEGDGSHGVWSHGAAFDIPIIEGACRRLGRETPWRFSHARDTRTLFWLAEGAGWIKPPRPATMVAHNALDDARYQALCVQSALGHLIDISPGEHWSALLGEQKS